MHQVVADLEEEGILGNPDPALRWGGAFNHVTQKDLQWYDVNPEKVTKNQSDWTSAKKILVILIPKQSKIVNAGTEERTVF